MNAQGTLCTVCTGCGKCFPGGRAEQLHIVTESIFGWGESVSAPVGDGGAGELLAADVGTTTIAMARISGAGEILQSFTRVNPQVRFGADVLSRIQAAKDPEKARIMRESVREVLAEGVRELTRSECVQSEPADDGLSPSLYIAANTTMSYLLLGYDPKELGEAPFYASHVNGGSLLLPRDTGISQEGSGNPASGILLPGFSAFVGGDLYAGALACGMGEREELQLLIDLGTNGEILLGNREGILGCATAAGPAFEGGPNRGIFGADMVHLTAELLRRGYVDETGLLRDPYFENGITIGGLTVTQPQIRAIQLAKAAIAAGTRILMERRGVRPERISRVILAGGFGYYLQPADAARIGLLPEELAAKAVPGGNTALAGAALYGRYAGQSAGQFAGQSAVPALPPAKILNLASLPEFETAYLEQLNFPVA
ncbi:MAG: ASKHA domain-containing protein [Lachnospiraceae bacterium]|nr:ASKHA domain-containing protein [Lachnospiraceae bacterium]